MQINKLLHPTDLSESCQVAMKLATELARRHSAELHLLHAVVFYNPADYFQDIDAIYAQLKQAAAKKMQQYVESAAAQDLKIEQVIIPAISAGTMITGYVTEYNIDLIVMSTHGRKGLEHLLLGSIAEEVVRTARCPVMTIRAAAKKVSSSFKRILAAIDFSEHSESLLQNAQQLAREYNSELHLLHVVEQPIYPAFYAFELAFPGDIISKIRSAVEEKLQNLAATSAVPARVHVIDGSPGRAITDFADKIDADLIILATRGLAGLDHLLLGSVADKVVRRANCPVLTVK
ncbi:MAG: universal stress protein [Acidobacteriota bacterium]|nr:universal stress protein [Blastocatellia bacterium]MDW8412150.1 universal stress protein [Acidobacteriota bacterium]